MHNENHFQQPANRPRRAARKARRDMSVKDRRAGRAASGLSMKDYKKGVTRMKSPPMVASQVDRKVKANFSNNTGLEKFNKPTLPNNTAIFDQLDPMNNSPQRSNKLGY